MYIIVDDRDIVASGYASTFNREGICLTSFRSEEFKEWVETANDPDLFAVEAVLIGDCATKALYPRFIKEKTRAPVLAMSEIPNLEKTLELFASGVDDVIRKPVHVREILARVGAIRRRVDQDLGYRSIGDLKVFSDGRDPLYSDKPILLPRRERRILEYLVANQGRRVTKTQIFNAIYGIFDDHVEENVIESHISKLRKKLRQVLGYDPIDSKRYLGYCLTCDKQPTTVRKRALNQ